MDNNFVLHQIASKADYIGEVARNAAYQGAEIGIVDSAKLRDILRKLEEITEAVEEYHDFDTMEGQTMYNSFISDFEKVYDMLFLSKEDFLQSYSYLTEKEYDETAKDILNHLFGRFTHTEEEG